MCSRCLEDCTRFRQSGQFVPAVEKCGVRLVQCCEKRDIGHWKVSRDECRCHAWFRYWRSMRSGFSHTARGLQVDGAEDTSSVSGPVLDGGDGHGM